MNKPRLIDANAINPMRCPQSIAEMRKWIDEQPTAYDVDKVVEQLEKLRKPWLVASPSSTMALLVVDEIEKAIEIVKKAVKDNDIT